MGNEIHFDKTKDKATQLEVITSLNASKDEACRAEELIEN